MVPCSVNYLLFGFTFGFLINGLSADECKKELGHLSDCQEKFVYCTVDKSWPRAESCIQCFPLYQNMVKAYSTLVDFKNCSEQILDRNRLNMVYLMQNTLVDIWNRGFCDDCFEGNSTSNSTLKFNSLKTDLENCLQNYNRTNVCMECIKYYVPLNEFYKDMEKTKSEKICFDTQDAMNVTRSKWSKDLNCCRREYSLTLFLIGSTIFGSLPFIFYGGMYLHTKRTERNHQVLDETSVADVPSTSAGVSSSLLAANPNTISNTTDTSLADDIRILKKKKALEDDPIGPTEPKQSEANVKEIDEQITSNQPSGNNLINL